jgi:uncharacterized protein (TIGR00299 family) protein
MTLSIHLDAVGGVAGDMFAAALVDALPDLRGRVLGDAAAVLPPGIGLPVFEPGMSGGLHCQRFRLQETTDAHHHHHHAGFRDMAARIEAANLSPGTAPHAIAILRLLAEAEAAIHHVPVDDVHFHEIGDWDSLMDVTAAGSIAAALEGAQWTIGTLPRGDGLVRTAHGLLPVPAPATARLLHGFIWRDDGIGGERVTPTGAAILRHLVHTPDATAAGRLQTTGTGAGTRELPGQPNILRATLYTEAATPGTEDILILAFEIDDMTGEELAIAADRLRATPGVRDLTLIPALGKKNRPVHSVQLLVEPPHREAVAEACFTETSTIGLRWQEARRAVLPRTLSDGDPVRVKTVTRPGGPSHKAESDDLARIAGLDARRAAKRAAEE